MNLSKKNINYLQLQSFSKLKFIWMKAKTKSKINIY